MKVWKKSMTAEYDEYELLEEKPSQRLAATAVRSEQDGHVEK